MLPLEKLKAVKHIITHATCPDGVASAMILRDVLPNATVTFQRYDSQEQINAVVEENVLFCDFSPHQGRVQAYKEAGAIVLDHHKSQAEIVKSFGELGVFADEAAEPGVCGATLAFREVWQPLMAERGSEQMDTTPEVRALAELAGIRDTWQTKSPLWTQACAQAEALTFWPVEALLSQPSYKWPEYLTIGPVLFEKKIRTATQCLKNGFTFTTAKGRRVVMFDNLRASSDAAEIAGEAHDFVVGFGYTSENGAPSLVYSTRSHTGFNCSAFAQAHGGGGHTAAAGFGTLVFSGMANPYDNLQALLKAYEPVEERWLQVLTEYKREAAARLKADPKADVKFDAGKAYQMLVANPAADVSLDAVRATLE